VPREYLAQCWSCLGEFDAGSAVWCTCSARTPTKLCPFCIHCFCQADPDYQENFWNGAPEDLREEREMLKNAPGAVGEALIRSNLLNTDQLLSALKYSRSRKVALDAAVIELGFVSRENLTLVSGQAQGGAAIDLARQLIDASLVSAVSVELCYRKRLLPISREEIGGNAVLTLAMAGPTDVETIDQIQTLTGCRIISMSAPEKEILDRLRDLFPEEIARLADDEAEAPVVSAPRRVAPPPRAPDPAPPTRRKTARMKTAPVPPPAAPAPAATAGTPAAVRRQRRAAAEAAASRLEELVPIEDEEETGGERPDPSPVPDPLLPSHAPPAGPGAPAAAAAGALQKILAEAITRKASHVQMEIRGGDLSLFLRVDGTLFRARPPAWLTASQLSQAVASCASLPEADRQAIGRLAVKAGERRIEVVARRRPFPGGESLFLKIVDPQQFFRGLEDLGPSALDRERILKSLALPCGLIVLSAPPHNGLDATRYSLLAHLAREGRRVLSIEAPRLISVERARQEEIPLPAGAAAARAAIGAAQGAEVLFLPEIDGAQTAALALEAATESLVVVPVQARRASQAPAALLWHRLDPAALASSLRLVVNQRLVRRLCEGCRTPTSVADHVFKMMGLSSDEALDLKVFQGGGCDRCGPLSPGYQGRVALFEVMEGTPEMAKLIGSGASPGELEREARRAGMSPLRAACLAAIGQGVTTLEEFQKGNF
jgi:type II secretory ATPase GspE/PulE/Tfp pilus assembly ATPase PilB-like protein